MRRLALSALGTLDTPVSSSICRQCARSFSTTRVSSSGHNKWSKTKHIKAVTDKKKTQERTDHARAIALYSRLHGDNPSFNPQLANAITAAAKASVPKALIENAVARGQGRSVAGTTLEPFILEVLMPPNIALIVDTETDNRIRTMHDLKRMVKDYEGVTGTTSFLFTKRGRTIFKAKELAPDLGDVLEEFIEHQGAEDIEELPEGGFLAWTEPAALNAVTKALTGKFDLEILDSDIIWAANEDTKVDINEKREGLSALVALLAEYPDVKAIYANVRQGEVADNDWQEIEKYIDT